MLRRILIYTLKHLFLLLYSMHYAEACNGYEGHNSESSCSGNTVPFKEMLQRWQVVVNTASDLTDPIFESQIYSLEMNSLLNYLAVNLRRSYAVSKFNLVLFLPCCFKNSMTTFAFTCCSF